MLSKSLALTWLNPVLFSRLQQSEDHTLAKIIRRIRKRKNQEKEERNSKKKKQPNENSPMGFVNVDFLPIDADLNMNRLNNPLSKKKKLLLNILNKNNCNNLSKLMRMKSLSYLQARMINIYQDPSKYGIHWSLKLKKINPPIKKTNLLR
ncbi:hypothetical protein PIB30_088377 [Stylosanthes scabra]|uniref:Uncharacterized protein n=1 Tax=Stylosanthes scabra TaxID=79078 RepID=A0ABU6STY0_9FABA|nr:hypothetical protein [Stylosanthes scabra]